MALESVFYRFIFLFFIGIFLELWCKIKYGSVWFLIAQNTGFYSLFFPCLYMKEIREQLHNSIYHLIRPSLNYIIIKYIYRSVPIYQPKLHKLDKIKLHIIKNLQK